MNAVLNPDELSEVVATLKLFDKRGMLQAKDLTFIRSLCKQYDQKGTLSEKQSYWANKLMLRAMGMDDGKKTDTKAYAKEKAAAVIKVRALFKWFDKAWASGLKKPSLVFKKANGTGPFSDPYVSDEVLPFNKLKVYPVKSYKSLGVVVGNTKVAWVEETGELVFKKYAGMSDTAKEEVVKFMTALGNDPVGVVKKYGKLSGKCVFCSSPLSDPKSLKNSYGPICAEHFGLPWG